MAFDGMYPDEGRHAVTSGAAVREMKSAEMEPVAMKPEVATMPAMPMIVQQVQADMPGAMSVVPGGSEGDDVSEQDAAVAPLSGEVFGMLINLSGRRRFTSQRLVLYAVLASQGHANAVATARDALKLFRDAHASLLRRGGDLPGVFCPELEDVYFGGTDGDRKIRHFIDLAGRTLNAIEDKLKTAPALLDELVQFTTPLLAILNQITAVYEEQSKRHARLMRHRLRTIMTDIETIAREAKMVAFNARIVAARAGESGKEFAVVAGVLSRITTEIDDLVKVALEGAAS